MSIEEKTKMVKLLNEKNIKPSVAPTIYDIYNNQLRGKGLTKRDVVTLIQDRTKLTRTQIEDTLDALFKIEKQLLINIKKK